MQNREYNVVNIFSSLFKTNLNTIVKNSLCAENWIYLLYAWYEFYHINIKIKTYKEIVKTFLIRSGRKRAGVRNIIERFIAVDSGGV